MTVVGEAVVQVRPNLSPFKREVEAGAARTKVRPVKVDADTRGFLGKLGPLKSAVAGIGTAFAAVKVAGFFKDSVKAASDLNESLSKTRVVFGSSSKDVEKFASDSARSLGISRQAALESTSTFGNLLVALKLGKKPAADMSQSIVALGSDLASFNNVRPEEALEALRAGLVGEVEPLRRFGVNLNDAALREKALALGLTKSTKDVLPPAIKAQAAYALIMEQTKTAQGDFARTSDGLANQQRILSARFTDLKAKIGAALLPAVLTVVGAFNTLLDVLLEKGPPAIDLVKAKFAELSAFLAPFVATLKAMGSALLEQLPSFSQVVAVLDQFKGAIAAALAVLAGFKIAAVIINGFRTAMIALNLVMALNPFVLVAVAVAALAAAFVIAYQRSEAFRQVVDAVVAAVRGALQGLVQWFTTVAVPMLTQAWAKITAAARAALPNIVAAIRTGIAIVKQLWSWFGGPMVTVLRGALEAAKTIVKSAITIISNVIQLVLNVIAGRWGEAWGNLKTIARTAITGTISVLRSLGGALLSAGAALAGKLLTGLKNKLAGVPTAVLSLLAKIPGVLVGLQGALLSAGIALGKQIIQGLINGMASLAGSVLGKARSIASSVTDTIAGALKLRSPSRVMFQMGVDTIRGFILGVDQLAPALRGKLSGAVKDAIRDAKQNLSSVAGSLASQLNTLLDAKLGNSAAGRNLGAAQQRVADLDFARQKADLEATIADAATSADDRAKAQADLDVLLAQRAFDLEQRKTDEAKAQNERRLADLATALNRGLITQQQYAAQVQELLASQGADYKSAGDNLGLAFADGFIAQVRAMIAQSVAIARAGLPSLNELAGITSPTETVGAELADARAALKQARADAKAKSSAGGTKITAAEQRTINAAQKQVDLLNRILDAMNAAAVTQGISIVADPDGFVKALGLQVTQAAR